MGLVRSLLGTMSSIFHVGGQSGPAIVRSSSKLQVRNAANDAMANLEVARGSADADASAFLDVKERVFLIEYSFAGDSAPSPGTNTSKYGICHTSGSGYTAGKVYYDPGSVALIAITPYKGQLLLSVASVSGTVSLGANCCYVAQSGTGPYSWTLKGNATAVTFRADGYFQIVDGIDITESQCAFTIKQAVVRRAKAGTSGTTEVDFMKNGTTIFTTTANRPKILYSAGDSARVTAVPDTTSVAAGDKLEMKILGIEGGSPQDLVGILEVQQ